MCLLLACLPAFSQGSAGRILGSVTDQSGGAIAGATVTVLDVQRGIPRTLITDQTGEYVAPSLLPGTYRVRAEFKSTERQNITLEVGQDIRVDLSLQPGEQTQTITVTEELPMIETTNASLGGTLSNETINELPMMGRSYQNLLTLRPGMMIYPGGGGWTMSTNGSRPEENQFILDGLTNDNPLQGLTIINGPGVAGDAATIMPVDAIQEVKIEENPKAEYGGKPGAVVNVGIKSGTNSIHGTAYAFGRDSALDARNYFNDTSQPKRSVALQQYGATIGGPIKKDKLFFFLGYEAESYSVGNLFFASVPEALPQPGVDGLSNGCAKLLAGDCANSLPDAISDLIASVSTPSALSLKLAGCTPPASGTVYTCTGGLFPTNNESSPNFPQGFPSVFRSDNGVAKIDFHINDHNALNGMYFQSAGSITAEDVTYLQPQWRSVQENRPRVAGISWTWTPNSSWVNSARFGFVRMNRMSQQVDSNVPPSNYGIFTGVTTTGSSPIIRLSGFTPLGGSPGWPYKFGPDTVFQFVDYVSYVRGNHAFKFGGDIRRNLADPSQFGAAKGAINFRGGSSLENFLLGDPTFATIQSGNPARQLSQTAFAASVQDDWRIRPRVTLNVGLRYDYTTPMAEAHNLLGGFDPNLGMVQVGKQIKSLYKGDHKNFGPRLGLAWDLTGKGTTVIRAGYGIIFNSLLPMQTFTGLAGNAVNVSGGVATVPTGATLVVNGVSTPGTGTIAVSNVRVPAGLAAKSGTLTSNWQKNSSSVPIFSSANAVECGDGSNDAAGNATSPCSLAVIDPNFRSPYVSNWTFGIQHAITNNLSVDVSYVGSHGSRLNGIRDINQAPAGAAYCLNSPLTAAQIADACSDPANPGNNAVQEALPLNAKFPYLGSILVLSNLYKSNYNGLQATLQQRTAHGLSFLASYTYSHSLDDDSYNIGQFLPQDSNKPALEYASSDFDIKHRFTFSITYAIPGKKSPAQLLEGWELNSVVTIQTGQPWYGNDQSNNISGTGENTDRWDFFGNPKDFTSNQNPIPFFQPGTPPLGDPLGSTDPTFAINNPLCTKAASTTALQASMLTFGCYSKGQSVLIAPALGTFGTSGRNIWRDPGLRNWDLSVTKQWKFQERLTAQFRAEFFNVLNHPNFTNPYGASSGFGVGNEGDPSVNGLFGCGCATPDQAAGNPVLGSGGNRAIQLGLKLIF